jgi:hypothetical protein
VDHILRARLPQADSKSIIRRPGCQRLCVGVSTPMDKGEGAEIPSFVSAPRSGVACCYFFFLAFAFFFGFALATTLTSSSPQGMEMDGWRSSFLFRLFLGLFLGFRFPLSHPSHPLVVVRNGFSPQSWIRTIPKERRVVVIRGHLFLLLRLRLLHSFLRRSAFH